MKMATTKAMSLKSNAPKVAAATETSSALADPMAHTFARKDFAGLDSDAAQQNIEKLLSVGKNARVIAHVTACGILLHYVETGDYTKLIPLRNAIAKVFSNSMAARLTEWVMKYSSLKWREPSTGKDGKKVDGNFYHVKGSDKLFTLEDTSKPDGLGGAIIVKGAINKPFYSFDRVSDLKVHTFDFKKFMEDATKRLHAELDKRSKAAEAGDKKAAKAIDLTPEQVAAFDKLATSLGASVKPANATVPANVN